MKNTKLMYSIGIVALVVLAISLGAKYSDKMPFGKTKTLPWTAVTLDNGLIYFGHLQKASSGYVNLTDAYFAQQNPKAPKPDEKTGKIDSSNTEPQYLLTKVGDTEVYGPSSEMKINRDHILLIQDLKPDSQVIKTIESKS